jgi:hypothetical protein
MRVEDPQVTPGDGWEDVIKLVECDTLTSPRQRALSAEQVERTRVLSALGWSLRSITAELGAGNRESLRRALRVPAPLAVS